MIRKTFFFLVALFIVILASRAMAADPYASAKFYRSDAWPKDRLIEHWVMDPGVSGDIWENRGDFEIWNDVGCPVGFVCTEDGASTISNETTEIYSKNTSVEFVTDGAGNYVVISTYYTLEPNQCYQWNFYTRGVAGTEDLIAFIADPSVTIYYNFATDAWGGLAFSTLTNIGTAWTRHSYFVRTGAAVRTNYRFYIQSMLWNANETSYIDLFELRHLNTCNVVGSRRNELVNPIASDPVWGDSWPMLPRTGTGPAYKTGMEIDGSNDYLQCVDATCEMDPTDMTNAGYLSFGCRTMPTETAAGNELVIGKWDTGGAGDRSWALYRNAANWSCDISKDGTYAGGSFTAVSRAVAGVDLYSSIVCTYEPITDGGSNYTIRLDHNAESTSAVAVSPVFDSAADLTIGAYGNPSNYYEGYVEECAVWNKELSSVERIKWISPYFPGTTHGDGFYVDTCTQAASHATCSSTKCRDGTPAACQAEGTGAMALFGQYTGLVDNNSFESITGIDSGGNFDNWTESEVAGDGSANITAYRADTVHWDIAARITTTGTTSDAYVQSECQTVGIGNDIYAEAMIKNIGITGTQVRVMIREFDTAACATQLASNNLYLGTIEAQWRPYGDVFPSASWNGATSSYHILVRLFESAGDVLVDNVHLVAGASDVSYRVPFVHVPSGGGTVTYNLRDYAVHNPLSDYIAEEFAHGYEDGFCISMWVYTDWADDGTVHFISYVPTTGGTDNIWLIQKNANDQVQFTVNDGAGVVLWRYLVITGTTWTEGGWKYVEACSDNTGTMAAHHYNVSNSTWYDWNVNFGAGTGIQDGQASAIDVGHAVGTNFLDGYISEIYLAPYAAIYPNKGFNGGRPPVNHEPY